MAVSFFWIFCSCSAGKKPGTRNRATLLNEMMSDDEAGAIARGVIDKALAGNAVAARFIIGRLMAPARDCPIDLDLHEGGNADYILVAANATVEAMAAGEIAPEGALTVTRVLDFRLKTMKAAARERAKNAASVEESPSPLAGPQRERKLFRRLPAKPLLRPRESITVPARGR